MSDLPTPKTRKTSNWSAIWILPLIALAIGAWLAWRAYDQAGVVIHIQFESGEGIQPNKTEVIFKGIAIGKVIDMHVNRPNLSVNATIEMRKESADYLSRQTRFWLVKPRVSLAGVTGLETLVSGNYIAVDPVKGDLHHDFVALKEPPPLSDSLPGLHLVLKAERLGSLEQGSPIYYRQIQVGQVKSYQLADDQKTIEVKIHIEPAYADLVRKNTRFWNASGITLSGNLTGLKLHTESLASIAAGGIAFATPENYPDSPPTDPSKPFRLYEDFDAAQSGLNVHLKVHDVSGLSAGSTPVVYNGVQVGTVKNIDMDQDFNGATATLSMDPRTEDFLNSSTEFWMVKPSISLAGITGLEALVKGNYIAVRFGKAGEPTREFSIRPKAPPLNLDAPGLHIVLTSDKLGSLDVGTPILYRQLQVGTVQSYQLSRDRQRVVIGVHIEPEYANLVNTSSRFWNVSGVTLSGDLNGIKFKSESLQTLISGGIAFDTPDPKAAALTKVRRFSLYDSEENAKAAGLMVSLHASSAEGLREGTLIRFKGMEVGRIEQIDLDKDLSGVQLKARLTRAQERIARQGSRFWVVKPQIGLSGAENLGTLVSGQYIEVLPTDKPAPAQVAFNLLEQAPNRLLDAEGLRLTLSAARRGSLKPGVPVTYREVQVGSVTSFELGEQGDRVLIHILIEPRYAPLVRSGSRFWNSSGVGVDAGLFKGVKLRTESVETILAGGVAFATPDNAQMGEPARPGQTFALFDEANDEWLQWAPKIPLDKAPALR
ncbi:PqiB family protein [Pseudomonas panipatensis]|uniref:Paraquat-inducible protein B n=1 Tax=Pseudomonas panipatensis TaxID=428992 RepID=A0A1G8MEL1_9PSED|nr:MlaD family protein [Pseudomonas panipatensis]SDI66364.1 paraquat-inducible protein B [Pseudomonas panipatensis]SMP76885.1 paraquat-inducible protein B [Pseudomonas panipatensis]